MKGVLGAGAAVLFFLLGFVAVQAAEQVPKTDFLLQSVQADFSQEKHLKILVRPILSKGRFLFQAPGSLRWEYKDPFRSILLMHGGKVRKFIDRDGRLVEDRGMRLDAMQVVLGEISGWLEGKFTDNATFKTSVIDEQTILLTPNEESLTAFISSIELKLADQRGLLRSVTIFEGPESFTRLLFSNTVLNRAVPVEVFSGP